LASPRRSAHLPKVSEAYLAGRRNQILEAAWACFGRRGYHETTMQDICKESGLSYGALYRYFESKEAIMAAIHDKSQAEALSTVATARSHTDSPLDALKAVGQEVFGQLNDPMCDSITKVHIEMLPEVLRRPEMAKGPQEELCAWRDSLMTLLAEARRSGALSPDVDPEALAVLLICTWEGLRIHHLIDRETFKPELVLNAIDALLAGVSNPK
jgi:AcrR family transcriptional regulator